MQKLYFLPILLILINCASQKKVTDFEELVYDATTRGRSENITLKGESLYYKTHQISEVINLTKDQLKQVDNEVSKINLDEINNLKAPTNKRLYDGAMHTSILIKCGSKNYTSASFDNTDPPIELKPLCDLLISFVQKK